MLGEQQLSLKETDRADAQLMRAAPGLAAWLRQRIDGFTKLDDIRRFRGGQSNPTYLLASGAKLFVLRSKPPGALLRSAHAIDREYRVLDALAPSGFPVPHPIAYCDDETITGRAFYLMSFVSGRGFQDPALPSLRVEQRARIYDGLVATLARLHCLDVRALGLDDFGRGDSYLARQLRRWSDQFRASSSAPVAEMERLSERLAATAPLQNGIALIHGDYKLDNLLFDDALTPVALLDWELATLGDPLADFTSLLIQWSLPRDEKTMTGGVSENIDGIPTITAMAANYCALTGRAGLPDLDWYLAYNLFRGSCICQGIAGRIRVGNAASSRAADVAARVPDLLAAATRHAEQAGIL
ncbi:phosphotransferase family protein [Sphingopyxis sp.]|uniref:phosphotransferase family protein n=1 Tax=Sphingopyxis sp. TaxID=1908224 RepID=UPI003D6D318A